MSELTAHDWIEIYYALESKLHGLAESKDTEWGQRWCRHLTQIMDKIGPDGRNMYEETQRVDLLQ